MLIDLYIDFTKRSRATRRHRQAMLHYHQSPLQTLPQIQTVVGIEPRRIARDQFLAIFGDVNPALVERLQEIWCRPHTSKQVRLEIFEQLKRALADPTLRDHTTNIPAGLKHYARWKEPVNCPDSS